MGYRNLCWGIIFFLAIVSPVAQAEDGQDSSVTYKQIHSSARALFGRRVLQTSTAYPAYPCEALENPGESGECKQVGSSKNLGQVLAICSCPGRLVYVQSG
ncbi:hypothetical protein WJX73_008534 [Symbiochloris irregularis]|uniref:Uncharacterized protein n=1 Tax=Symbiochloris irregularis TaxID=706552 RepID=A0AAW1PEH1_9CHLO